MADSALAVWTPPAGLRVTAVTHAFSTQRIDLELEAGPTLAELVAQAGIPSWAHARVWIDDSEMPRAWWHLVRPKPGHQIVIRAIPGTGGGGGGGNKTLRLVLMLVVVVVAAVVTWGVGALIAGGALGAGLATGGAFAAVGSGIALAAGSVVAAGLGMLINSLVPPPSARLRDISGASGGGGAGGTSPTYSITGTRNVLAPYQAVPRVLGRHRIYPPLAASPVTEGSGQNQFLSEIFCWGYGPLTFEEFRIGDTPVGHFQDLTGDLRLGFPDDAPMSTFPYNMFQEDFTIDLFGAGKHGPGEELGPWISRTTRPDTEGIGVDIVFPNGLIAYARDAQGNLTGQTVEAQVWLMFEAQEVGTSQWISLPWSPGYAYEKRRDTLRMHFGWGLPPYGPPYKRSQWTIRVRHHTNFQGSIEGENFIGRPFWTTLISVNADDPIRSGMRDPATGQPLRPGSPAMAKAALKIRASEQLSGVIDQLNAVAWSYLWDYDPAAPGNINGWINRPSRNPCGAFIDVLTGPANARPLPIEQLDLNYVENGQLIHRGSLERWSQYCATYGFTFDAVIDSQTTVFSLLRDICAAGRASFTIVDGRYGVVIDEPRTIPVQVFTPRNSSNFSARRVYADIPHALKVRFINKDANWQQDERIVYDDGFSAANATKFEVLDTFGIVEPFNAHRMGRYYLATMRLRPEQYSLTVDVESLIATRGDLVEVVHDVPLWGIGAARILSIHFEAEPPFIEVDEWFNIAVGGYSMRIRLGQGDAYAGVQEVKNVWVVPQPADPVGGTGPPGKTTRIYLLRPTPTNWSVGDLITLGMPNQASIQTLVQRIEPGADLTATLTLVDYAPAIYGTDLGPIPPFDSQVTRPPGPFTWTAPPPPIIISATADEAIWAGIGDLRVPTIRIVFMIPSPTGSQVNPTHVLSQYRPLGSEGHGVPGPTVQAAISFVDLVNVERGTTYEIGLRSYHEPRSLASDWATVQVRVPGVGQDEGAFPPPPINLRREGMTLRWDYPNAPADFAGFEVRLAFGTATSWDGCLPMHQGLVGETSFPFPALSNGAYTFAVKAVDSSGNRSRTAAFLQIQIGGVEAGNILQRIDYGAMGYPGSLQGLEYLSGPPPQLCTIRVGGGAPAPAPGLFWSANDTLPFWMTDTRLFWGQAPGSGDTGNFEAGTYLFKLDVTAQDAGSALTFEWAADLAGNGWTFEYRKVA